MYKAGESSNVAIDCFCFIARLSPHRKLVKWEKEAKHAWKEMKKFGDARQGFLQQCCMLCIVFF